MMDDDVVKPASILSKVANKQEKIEWKSSPPIKTYSKKSSPNSGGHINADARQINRLTRNICLNDFTCDDETVVDSIKEYIPTDLDIDVKLSKEDEIDDLLLTEMETNCDYLIDMELPRPQETQTIPLPLPLRDVKAEPEELDEPDPPAAVEDDDDGIKLGDLAWASVASYPYWPCLVTNDPETHVFIKERGVGKATFTFYHVTYFGDRGRRNWVKSSGMKRYNGINTFKALAEKYSTPEVKKKSLKLYKAYTVQANQKRAWNKAVDEAESLRLVPRDERLNFFQKFQKKKRQFLPIGRKTPTRGPIDKYLIHGSVDSETSIECSNVHILDDQLNLVICNNNEEVSKLVISSAIIEPSEKVRNLSMPEPSVCKKRAVKRRYSTASDGSEHLDAKAIKLSKDAHDAVLSEISRCGEDDDDSTPKRYSVRLVTRSSIEDTYPLTPSPSGSEVKTPSDASELPPSTDEHPLKQVVEDNAHLSPAVAKTLLELWKKSKGGVVRKKISKITLRKTPPATEPGRKTSDGSLPFAVPSKPSVTKVNRTSTLFSEVKHDKVCAICFVPGGDLFKCKGPCNLFMHPDCWDKPRYQLTNAERFLAAIAPMKPVKRKFRRKSRSTMSVFSDRNEDDKMSVFSEDLQGDLNDRVLTEVSSLSVEVPEDAPYPSPPPSFQDETDILSKLNGNGCVDAESLTSETSEKSESDGPCPMPAEKRNWKCKLCTDGAPGPCFICGEASGVTLRCKATGCGKDFHESCVSIWPQKSLTPAGDSPTLICPMHTCHVCASENPQSVARGGVVTNRLVRCVLCPSTYHSGDYCVTAGSKILSATQIICPRHYKAHGRSLAHLSCTWCAICCRGGSLICCDICPLIFHPKCLEMNGPPPENFICENCEEGRFPVYGEIVWVKLGVFRWWPAKILYPNQIPLSLKKALHTEVGEFPVQFFGTHDFAWVNRGRTFIYVDGDSVSKLSEETASKDKKYELALTEAADEKNKQNHEKALRVSLMMPTMKPPKFVRIQSNKQHRSVARNSELDKHCANTCECDPNSESPCGPDSVCINRLLMVECDDGCAAGKRCQNRCFSQRQYPRMEAFLTETRGWGLRTLAPLKTGDFVIEYVGEMIGTKEYESRLEVLRKNKDEKYYFLEIDKDRILDAGPKGNLSRFMNHSCDPNCETQKWTVDGDTRIGLFATRDIPAGSELVFNYNLATLGNARLECRCGADNCSGFIGGKIVKNGKSSGVGEPKNGLNSKKKNRSRSKKAKKRPALSPVPVKAVAKRRSSVASASVEMTVSANKSEEGCVKIECSSCCTPAISERSTIKCDECSGVFHLTCVDVLARPRSRTGSWKCSSHDLSSTGVENDKDIGVNPSLQ